MKPLSITVLRVVLEDPRGECRYSEIMERVEEEDKTIPHASLDVKLSRTLKALGEEGYLTKDNRGYGVGVWYSISPPRREDARTAVYVKEELPSRLRSFMSKPEEGRSTIVRNFPEVFIYF